MLEHRLADLSAPQLALLLVPLMAHVSVSPKVQEWARWLELLLVPMSLGSEIPENLQNRIVRLSCQRTSPFFPHPNHLVLKLHSKRKVDLCVCADSRWHLAADQLAGSDAI